MTWRRVYVGRQVGIGLHDGYMAASSLAGGVLARGVERLHAGNLGGGLVPCMRIFGLEEGFAEAD